MFLKPNYSIGVGVNYRSEIADDLLKNIQYFDFIEINTERFFNENKNEKISEIVSKVPIIIHGLTLSLGSLVEDVSDSYLNSLSAVHKKVDFHWYSEHMAVTRVNDIEMRTLMPVEFSHESMDIITNKVKKVMSVSNKPFLLENITYYYSMPNSEMSEIDYVLQIISSADCGILLDLNNLYVNSINHGYDPYDYIDKLPLDRVVEVHMAGCDYISGMLVDTHASRIKKPVLNLLKYLNKKIQINGVVIERDDKLDNIQELIDEVRIVKEILN